MRPLHSYNLGELVFVDLLMKGQERLAPTHTRKQGKASKHQASVRSTFLGDEPAGGGRGVARLRTKASVIGS